MKAKKARKASQEIRTWAPIDTADAKISFRIDSQIEALHRAGRFAERWRPRFDELKAFARRALEVAVFQALAVQQRQAEVMAGLSGGGPQSWTTLSHEAPEALARIERLISRLGPASPRKAQEPCDLAHVLRQVLGPSSPQVEVVARALFDARAALQSVADAANARRRLIKGERKNEGQADKRQFVHVFVEFWIVATDRKPPLGESSPFMDLLRAAWEDAGNQLGWKEHHKRGDESFQSPLRNVLRSMTAEQTARLRGNPPIWW